MFYCYTYILPSQQERQVNAWSKQRIDPIAYTLTSTQTHPEPNISSNALTVVYVSLVRVHGGCNSTSNLLWMGITCRRGGGGVGATMYGRRRWCSTTCSRGSRRRRRRSWCVGVRCRIRNGRRRSRVWCSSSWKISCGGGRWWWLLAYGVIGSFRWCWQRVSGAGRGGGGWFAVTVGQRMGSFSWRRQRRRQLVPVRGTSGRFRVPLAINFECFGSRSFGKGACVCSYGWGSGPRRQCTSLLWYIYIYKCVYM